MTAFSPIFRLGKSLTARDPVRSLKGLASAYVAYPIAEKLEKRHVRPKLAELRRFHALSFEQRRQVAKQRLFETLAYAKSHVPYYRDVLSQRKFCPERVLTDPDYMHELPYLTKDVILEQGDRLLSSSLSEVRYHACKTGGSTGSSCVIYYNQESADYSAAVNLFTREQIGKFRYMPETHFACRFPGDIPKKWPSREDLKCMAMNRANIFFDRLDDYGLEEIWSALCSRRPYLVHAHPSTIYALACYVAREHGQGQAFSVFESSGELLELYQRDEIERALCCRVVNRYGLAELGVVAYEFDASVRGLRVLESEVWPETRSPEDVSGVSNELVFTSLRNRLMPLIRYATGDLGILEARSQGFFLADVVGRIHDVVPLNGVPHPTHHIQDVLDHRVGSIQEFQIDLRTVPPTLRVVPEPEADQAGIATKIQANWPGAFEIDFVGHKDLVRVGERAKFRHVVNR